MPHLNNSADVARPVVVEECSPRIQKMVAEILVHGQVIAQFETGQVILNFSGDSVRFQLDKCSMGIHRAVDVPSI